MWLAHNPKTWIIPLSLNWCQCLIPIKIIPNYISNNVYDWLKWRCSSNYVKRQTEIYKMHCGIDEIDWDAYQHTGVASCCWGRRGCTREGLETVLDSWFLAEDLCVVQWYKHNCMLYQLWVEKVACGFLAKLPPAMAWNVANITFVITNACPAWYNLLCLPK